MDGKDVLIVDDEPFISKALSFVLKKAGYGVRTAPNGKAAMEMIEQAKPEIMFLDIMMPLMNGYEVCEAIKSDPALGDIHVIMLSAKGQQQDEDLGLALGADEYMTKPFSPTRVLQRVTELLGPVCVC